VASNRSVLTLSVCPASFAMRFPVLGSHSLIVYLYIFLLLIRHRTKNNRHLFGRTKSHDRASIIDCDAVDGRLVDVFARVWLVGFQCPRRHRTRCCRWLCPSRRFRSVSTGAADDGDHRREVQHVERLVESRRNGNVCIACVRLPANTISVGAQPQKWIPRP